jgi:hypothetical protein
VFKNTQCVPHKALGLTLYLNSETMEGFSEQKSENMHLDLFWFKVFEINNKLLCLIA